MPASIVIVIVVVIAVTVTVATPVVRAARVEHVSIIVPATRTIRSVALQRLVRLSHGARDLLQPCHGIAVPVFPALVVEALVEAAGALQDPSLCLAQLVR